MHLKACSSYCTSYAATSKCVYSFFYGWMGSSIQDLIRLTLDTQLSDIAICPTLLYRSYIHWILSTHCVLPTSVVLYIKQRFYDVPRFSFLSPFTNQNQKLLLTFFKSLPATICLIMHKSPWNSFAKYCIIFFSALAWVINSRKVPVRICSS